MTSESDKVYIFDTTLRDGEQSAGISFTMDEKVEIARQLAKLNVDIIEAGFPATSPGEVAGKPASMMSTFNFASCRAISTFSSIVNEMPADCSPSRNVVSKM